MKRTLCILLSLLLCAGALLLPAAAEEPPADTTVVTESAPAAEDTTTDPAATDTTAATDPAATDTTAATEPAATDTTAATEPAATDPTAATDPAAEDTTAATEPEKTTEPQPETTTADTDGEAQTPALSPYYPPKFEDYNGDKAAFDAAEHAWYNSINGRYYNWRCQNRGSYVDEREKFDPAFRAFYADDPDLKIKDHIVYQIMEITTYQNRKAVKSKIAMIFDYFDTDKIAKKTTTLRIPATIDGLPVATFMHSYTDWSAGDPDSGYTNNSVKKLILEEGITSIGKFAFSGFTALKAVRLPKSLTQIGIGAFKGCVNLQKVNGAGGVKTVCSSAFQDCAKLTAFENIDKITSFEGAAFYGCGFKTLTLSGKATIGGGDEDHYFADRVFGDCKSLKKVTFLSGSKKTTMTIGINAFMGCTALKTVVLPTKSKAIRILDLAFDGCTSLKSLKNTGKITVIDQLAFRGCKALTAITLPEKLDTCAYNAFDGCKNLKTVTILSKDTALFDKHYEVDMIHFGWPNDSRIGTNFLSLLPKTCTVLVVNKAMKDAVKAHDFKGTVKIRVSVKAPAAVKATKQNGKVTVKWSNVKSADGYRVYAYNAKTGKLTKLATVKAGTTTVTLKTSAARIAVRAWRVIDGDVSWSAAVKKAVK